MQSKLKLNTGSNYLSNETDHRGTDPAKAFKEVVDAMTSIGFDTQVRKAPLQSDSPSFAPIVVIARLYRSCTGCGRCARSC